MTVTRTAAQPTVTRTAVRSTVTRTAVRPTAFGRTGSAVAHRPVRGERLDADDATFWFVGPALGWSVVLQIVWVFDEEVGVDTVRAMNTVLAQGRLHRRLRVPRVVGARPQWVPAPDVPALAADTTPVDEADIDGWATEEMSTVPLDPEAGRCWRLRSAPTVTGGTVISLCALHVVTDGRGMLAAAAEAAVAAGVAGDGGENPADPRHPSPPDGALAWGSDVLDAVSQVGAVLRGLVRAAAERRRSSGSEPDPRRVRAPIAQRSPQARGRWATASVPVADWDRVAAAHGGTANTLFIAAVTGLLRSSGHAPLGDPIKVGVPVDRREGAGDDRANAIAGVSLHLTGEPVPGHDLGPLRAACKDAFRRLSAGRRAPHVHLRSLAWFLPSSVIVTVVGAGNGMPDAVVSNLGDVPSEALILDGHTVRTVAFRGMAQGVDPALPQRFGDGVQSWLVRTPEEVTFTVLACDESSFESDTALAGLLAGELAAWGLPYRIW